MYLKAWKEETRAQRPSFRRSTNAAVVGREDVNGDAIDASC
jgi:hypothetical protein